jgi:biotin transport system substrate-specific component
MQMSLRACRNAMAFSLGGIGIINVRNMVLCSLFAALTALCAWLSVPIPPITFTMQTFAVLLCLGILGGKWGSVSVLLYLLLGLVGVPVFAGFRGGVGCFLEPAGGFLWGFLAGALAYWVAERLGKLPAMVCSLLVCWVCGSWWFSDYAGVEFFQAVTVCALPWVIPDSIKLALAYTLSGRIGKHLKQ